MSADEAVRAEAGYEAWAEEVRRAASARNAVSLAHNYKGWIWRKNPFPWHRPPTP